MALDPHSTPDDDSIAPPSFIPSSARKHSASQADSASIPPSFTPSGESGKPTMTPAHQQTPVGGKQPMPPREPRRAGGSSRTLHADGASHAPQSASSARSSVLSFSPDARASGAGSHMGNAGAGNGGRPLQKGQSGTGQATARKHRPARVVATIVVSLIAILAVLAAMMYFWVNGQLQHFDALTTAADDSSQTWLITGSDVRDGTEKTGAKGSVDGERTDTIMLLVKPKKGATALISIPRDTFVTVDGTDMKINSVAQNYGWKKLSAQVENISGLKVDHFVRIGFGGVKNVVDALGGVKLCYDSTVNDVNSGLKWTAGCHTADGDTALAFSRMRYSDPEGDFGRTKRQRQVIQAIAKKAASKSTLTNFSKTQKVVKSALSAIKVDENASPYSLLKMAMAFKDATGSDGITGTIYYSNPSYYPPSGIGSTVLMDSDKTSDLFTKIADGTQKKGTVGGYVE